MNKLDKFTFLIPIFNLKDERFENFKFVLTKIKEVTDRILVVEQVKNNRKTEARKFAENLKIEYLPVKIKDDVIHKSKLINEGTEKIDTEFVWVNDADCYLKFNKIIDDINFLEYDFIQPYVYAKMLSREESLNIRKNIPIKIIFNEELLAGFGALSFIFKKSAFIQIGSMCEDARGWGFEDQEFNNRVKSTNFVKILEYKGIHLYHKRPTNYDPLMREYKFNKINQYGEWCEFCKKIPVPEEIPIIDKNSNKKSILIDSRIFPHTYFTIKNTIQKLGPGWGHTIFTSKQSYSKMVEICSSISSDIQVKKINNLSSRNDYNNILLDISFWEELNCEYCIIYQHDSILLNGVGEKYFKYDYIGAPWDETFCERIKKYYNYSEELSVGNGGLSLRRVEAMIDCLRDISSSAKKLISNNIHKELDKIPEDIFFSFMCKNVADRETATNFAIEYSSSNSYMPLINHLVGAHSIYNFINYKQAIEDIFLNNKTLPTLYIIRGVYDGGASLYVDNLKKILRKGYQFVEINNKQDLQKIEKNSTLFINHLYDSDITIQDILSLDTSINIHLFIHDFYFLNQRVKLNTHDLPQGNAECLDAETSQLFTRVKSIVVNSVFTKEVYIKVDSIASKIIYIPPIDLPSNNILNIQTKIINNQINIGIITNITKCKGLNLYKEIFKIKKFKKYNIVYHIFGRLDTRLYIPDLPNVIIHGEYKEVEIFNLLKKAKINGLLLLNEKNMPETYCYAATKCIISSLPVLYSSQGALIKRFGEAHLNRQLYIPLDYSNINNSCNRLFKKIINTQSEINSIVETDYGNKLNKLIIDVENSFSKFNNLIEGI